MSSTSGPETAEAFSGRTSWARGMAAALRDYLRTEVGGAIVLLAAALVALAWANLPGGSYETVWTTHLSVRLGDWELTEDLRHWVNDGLMTFFFFVVGLEVRRELDMGELRERRRVAVPVIAALGGMVVPALIYLAINAGGPGARAWGVAMPTDTALALGVLALVGPSYPQRLRVFVLTLVVVDDIASLIVIAVAYTRDLSLLAFAVAVVLFGVVFLLRFLRVWRGPAYFVVGVALWVAMLSSGVHPAVAGVAMGLLATAYPPRRQRLERAVSLTRMFREQPTPEFARSARLSVDAAISGNERLQYLLHPWTSYVIVPLFALANAGVVLRGSVLASALRSPVGMGVVAGLVLGKLIGISGTSWLATRPRLGRLPLTVPLPQLVGASAVAGIGFTVSLFIADLSLGGPQLQDAKIGILAASIAASILGSLIFKAIERLPQRLLVRSVAATAPLPEELATPADPERDHVRGPAEAPVTLLEYGDYECPYCGRAEAVVRELLAAFSEELRYVFRHLPLTDVHQRADLAAEAAEAAGAQGRFWEMHDLLFANQDALEPADLRQYAAQLGLDVDQFWEEVRSRAHARRVAEDARSADESGVAGTPTFFINGRRHQGPYDLQTLTAAVRLARHKAQIAAAASRDRRSG
ncbi:MAG TPA: Na+/H+ antiporter NhaA [Actinomycetes bacterium]|nr:Na+/H+ antiporter NhaA [Actinomycetes bacterium]